jgi:hypothetical protein
MCTRHFHWGSARTNPLLEFSSLLSRNSIIMRPGLGRQPGRGLGRGHEWIRDDLLNAIPGKFASDQTVQVQVQAGHPAFGRNQRIPRQKLARFLAEGQRSKGNKRQEVQPGQMAPYG